jgi:hypothetical protein
LSAGGACTGGHVKTPRIAHELGPKTSVDFDDLFEKHPRITAANDVVLTNC